MCFSETAINKCPVLTTLRAVPDVDPLICQWVSLLYRQGEVREVIPTSQDLFNQIRPICLSVCVCERVCLLYICVCVLGLGS